MRFYLSLFATSLLLCNSTFASSMEPWGIDAGLHTHARPLVDTPPPPPAELGLGQKTSRQLIHFFQAYISPIDGPRSSYSPTSSQYTWDAIQKYGFFKGWCLGCDRLMRENNDPWVYPLVQQEGITRKLEPVR